MIGPSDDRGETMLMRLCVILAACGLALVGCRQKAPGGLGPIIVVTASYPGANARTVADVVAAPIEQQVNGVEGMVRIESESGNDGGYIARARFKPDAGGPDNLLSGSRSDERP
jgi:multidrug efflux pump subunit AcrB